MRESITKRTKVVWPNNLHPQQKDPNDYIKFYYIELCATINPMHIRYIHEYIRFGTVTLKPQ